MRSIETALRAGRRARNRPRHHGQLLRPHPDDHPLGLEPLHRDAHRAGPRPASAATSGASSCSAACRAAAWGSSSIRQRKTRGPGLSAGADEPRRSAGCKTPCRSPWSRWSTISPSTTAARSATLWQGDDALMPPGYYALCAPEWLRQDVHGLSPTVRGEIARFAAACRTHPRLAGSTDLLLGALFPSRRRGTTRPDEPEKPARGERLRSGTARADSRRPAGGPHRTGPEPPAGQRDRSRTFAADDVIDGRSVEADADDPPSAANGRLAEGEVAVLDPGRRGGKPLDARGRRRQGPAPLLPFPGPLPQLHRGPPGQEPPRGRTVRRRRAAMSSPPAT